MMPSGWVECGSCRQLAAELEATVGAHRRTGEEAAPARLNDRRRFPAGETGRALALLSILDALRLASPTLEGPRRVPLPLLGHLTRLSEARLYVLCLELEEAGLVELHRGEGDRPAGPAPSPPARAVSITPAGRELGEPRRSLGLAAPYA
jgi:hypothetical protein